MSIEINGEYVIKDGDGHHCFRAMSFYDNLPIKIDYVYGRLELREIENINVNNIPGFVHGIFDVSGCTGLKTSDCFPDADEWILDRIDLEEIDNIRNVSSVRKIKITNCNDLKKINLDNFHSLNTIEITNANKLTSIKFNRNNKYYSLYIDKSSVSEIIDLETCINVYIFNSRIRNMNGFPKNCRNVKAVYNAIENLDGCPKRLHTLDITGNKSFNKFTESDKDIRVDKMYIGKLSINDLKNIPDISEFLEIRHIKNLQSFDGLENKDIIVSVSKVGNEKTKEKLFSEIINNYTDVKWKYENNFDHTVMMKRIKQVDKL